MEEKKEKKADLNPKTREELDPHKTLEEVKKELRKKKVQITVLKKMIKNDD